MSFAGHVIDMINRQKQNRELLSAHRDRVKYVRGKYLEYGVRHYVEFKPKHKALSEAEKRIIRERINRDYRVARFKSMAVTAIVIMLLLYGAMWFIKVK